jgi:hypothetical protein
MGIGKFLDAFKAVMALLTLVFVKWHGLPETLQRASQASAFTIPTEN